MEMEKRKGREDEEEEESTRGNKVLKKEKAVAEAVAGEEEEEDKEEMEEFYAILRNVKMAAKYFEKPNNREGWTAAIEAEVAATMAGAADEEINGVLDLNTVPEEKINHET